MQIIKKTTSFDFMGKRRKFFIASMIVFLLSLVGMFAIGPKFGIDFMGGTEVQVDFQQSVGPGEIRRTLESLGFEGAEVVSFGAHESEYLIRLQAISPVTPEQEKAAERKMVERFGDNALSRFELSPGGDKLMLRLDESVEIARVEEAVTGAGLALGEAGEARVEDAGARVEDARQGTQRR